ncbi:BREX-1 system phosphatase PglZ type B [Allochromatium vinosum]|uniref:BREX-1 system phosphatase PglZ type B n=1 Tax=Allochromatium vinosum TaxID=1049 RepID=UPI00190337B9|nr:BREX-1 system phosphatase PglZ type B [Allochromatium vinosum]MBK1656249.1 hypothetical protein [Allochromatium vinosum]
MTLLDALLHSLAETAKVNHGVQVAPAAILWTDVERQWQSALPRLRQALPNLAGLGDYQPELRQGPAIWLKCVVAGRAPEVDLAGRPAILYLPGVSRTDLRAIESCPRALQPLAELQYRGVFWSHANGKDWTLNAFLTSRHGGQGLDVSQDKATQEALLQALGAGVLLDRALTELQGRRLNADWLHSLLAPNPTRDLLAWLNDPERIPSQWEEARWSVFLKRCTADFGFHPLHDGPLTAAERLARGDGPWAAVAELYRDSFTSFPNVYDWLLKVQPPQGQLELFNDPKSLAGYPQVNEQQETALRYALAACGAMPPEPARTAVLEAERHHCARLDWLWSRMGLSPLATALHHLADLAERSRTLPRGTTPEQLAQSYREDGWRVDAAALSALGAVQSKADLDAVGAAVRALYLPWLDESARRLQEAAMSAGGLPSKLPSPSGRGQGEGDSGSNGTCLVFVDGLRYDVAIRLKERLESLGRVELEARWSSLPSVTASGKVWCSPVAPLAVGDASDQDFTPQVAGDGKPLSAHHFRRLLTEQGFQPLDSQATGDPTGRAWTEAGDLDHYGHEHGLRLARDLDHQLDQIVERLTELRHAGWRRLRVVTDHGWLLLPGGLPKAELPRHQAETKWGRCALVNDSAYAPPLTFGWSWCDEVQVAYAPGASAFIAGKDYDHGGLSLQECLVPALLLETAGSDAANLNAEICALTWKGLRCIVEVETAVAGLRVDIRTKAALASTSLVAGVKTLDAGKANLAIADDDQFGTAAVVVILAPNGEVIQKSPTTIGG